MAGKPLLGADYRPLLDSQHEPLLDMSGEADNMTQRSALMGVGFPEVTLSFPGGEPAWDGTYDSDGNPNMVGGGSITLRVKLKETGNPAVLDLVGHDPSRVPLLGRCLQPLRIPEGVKPGATAPMTNNGQPGVFTLLPWYSGEHEAKVDAIGQAFAGYWTSV